METKDVFVCEKNFLNVEYIDDLLGGNIKAEGIRVSFFQPAKILDKLIIDNIFLDTICEKNVKIVKIISAMRINESFIEKILIYLHKCFPLLEVVKIDAIVEIDNWFDECNNEFQINDVVLCIGELGVLPLVEKITFLNSRSNDAINNITINEPNLHINFQEKDLYMKIRNSYFCKKNLKFTPSKLLETMLSEFVDHTSITLEDLCEGQEKELLGMINVKMDELLNSQNLGEVVVDMDHQINKDLVKKHGINYFSVGDRILSVNRSHAELVVKTVEDHDGNTSNKIILKALSIFLPSIRKLRIKSRCSDTIVNNGHELMELFNKLLTLKIKTYDFCFLNLNTLDVIKNLVVKIITNYPYQRIKLNEYFPKNLKNLSIKMGASLNDMYDDLIKYIRDVHTKIKEPLKSFSITFYLIYTAHSVGFDEDALISCLKNIVSVFRDKTTKLKITIIDPYNSICKQTDIMRGSIQFDVISDKRNILRKLDLIQENKSIYGAKNKIIYHFHKNDHWSLRNYSRKTERNSGILLSILCSLKVFCKKYMFVLPKPVLLTVLLPNIPCYMLEDIAKKMNIERTKRKFDTI